MELVYLWIEKYKNIEKQGFNFSPRFKCEFKDEYDENGKLKDNCELIIEENKDYVSIFPDNINITAIVGENGSGKSSILLNINTYNKTKYILLYKTDNKIGIHTNIKDITNHKIDNYNNSTFDYFSFTQDLFNVKSIKNYSSFLFQDLTLNHNVLSEIYTNGNHFIDLATYKNIINKIIFQSSDVSEIFPFSVKEIKIYKTFGNIKTLLQKLQPKLKNESYAGTYQDSPINIYEYLISDFNNLNDKGKFLMYIFLKHYEIDNQIINLIYKLFENIDLNFIDLKDEIFNYENKKLKKDKIKLMFNSFKSFYNLIDNENINNKKQKIKNLPDGFNVIFELEIQKVLDIEFYDEKNRKFSDLSHGERHIFSVILLIYNKLINKKSKHKLILLDEPDNTLHPQWQKKLINSFITTFSKINNFIHIILTSHSPFILSDLPKENVIFLKKDEKTGNCINDTNNVDINPFGANIHTLLSHGFFMKNGLMGEFAKSKISKILKFLNGENRFIDLEVKILPPLKIQNNFFEKNLRPIIEFIGEDFLKEKLLRMYEIKFPKSNEAKIKELENEIKRLKNASN